LIESYENGWIVIDPGQASGMMLKKDSWQKKNCDKL
jgi:hypothetical protein